MSATDYGSKLVKGMKVDAFVTDSWTKGIVEAVRRDVEVLVHTPRDNRVHVIQWRFVEKGAIAPEGYYDLSGFAPRGEGARDGDRSPVEGRAPGDGGRAPLGGRSTIGGGGGGARAHGEGFPIGHDRPGGVGPGGVGPGGVGPGGVGPGGVGPGGAAVHGGGGGGGGAVRDPPPIKVPIIAPHPYPVDTIVDVLDIYPGRATRRLQQCWTMGTVVDVDKQGAAKIRFDGYGEEDDRWIFPREFDTRLAPFGTNTVNSKPRSLVRKRLKRYSGPVKQTPVPLCMKKGSHADVFHDHEYKQAKIIAVKNNRAGELSSVIVQCEGNIVLRVEARDVEYMLKPFLSRTGPEVAATPITARGGLGKGASDLTSMYEKGMYVTVLVESKHARRELKGRRIVCQVESVTSRTIRVRDEHTDGWEEIDMKHSGYRIGTNSQTDELNSQFFKEKRVAEEDGQLRKSLAESGLRVHNIIADGHCLFRCVSYLFTGTEDNFMMIRKGVVEHMRLHRAFYQMAVVQEGEDFDAYLRRMLEDHKEWGGYPEQMALEEMYDRPVEIYSPTFIRDKSPITFRGSNPDLAPYMKGKSPIRVAWVRDQTHFHVLLREEDKLPYSKPTTDYILRNRQAGEGGSGDKK